MWRMGEASFAQAQPGKEAKNISVLQSCVGAAMWMGQSWAEKKQKERGERENKERQGKQREKRVRRPGLLPSPVHLVQHLV